MRPAVLRRTTKAPMAALSSRSNGMSEKCAVARFVDKLADLTGENIAPVGLQDRQSGPVLRCATVFAWDRGWPHPMLAC